MSILKCLRFSNTQKRQLQEIAKKMGKTYKGKFVIYNGQRKEYTEVLDESGTSMYTDSILVVKGDINKMILENDKEML